MGNSPDPAERSRAVALVLVVLLVGVLVAVRVFSDGEAQAPVATPAGEEPGAATSAPGRPVVRPLEPDPTPVPEETLAGIRFEDVTEQAGGEGVEESGPETGTLP